VKLWENPKIVSLTPIATTLLLESANVSQLHQMWSTRSSADQSILSWVMVQCALWMWLNFYQVKTPGEWFAIWATRVGILLNTAVIVTAFYFRL
jgi:hypothetical protein